MKILLIGVNHKTAPIEVRERLAIEPSRLAEATTQLLRQPGVREGMILSTCNRVELLLCREDAGEEHAGLGPFLSDYFSLDLAELRPHLYEYSGPEAVRHLFRVAASLDSMVVGEPQILGQVKESYSVARGVGAVQSTLDRLLQSAFTVAKKVRTETQIGNSSVSVASVAVDLAQKIFGSLRGKRIFLVGAGKMSELAARHLMQQGAGSLLVTNRTFERAQRLAEEFGAQAVPFEELHATANQADIVITSTGASEPVFRPDHLRRFVHQRRNRPMFFIDIAVPRDVDPEANKVEGVFLYDIDDLQSVAAAHMEDRSREAEQAESIVARELRRYQERQHTLNVVPTIVELQQTLEDVRQAELRRAGARLQSLTPEQMAVVEALTRGLMNKFLHPPLSAIKAAARNGDAATVEAIRSVFDLASEAVVEPAHEPLSEISAATDESEVPAGLEPRK